MVDFFIKRPIFAIVCSILIVLAGGICIPLLPIAQYPQIALPQVSVSAFYTGASSEVVVTNVQKLRDGAPITPMDADAGAPGAAPAPSASAAQAK